MELVPIELRGRDLAQRLIVGENVFGDDDQDTVLLRRMLIDAKQYISSFSWCEIVLDSYFGGGVGGIWGAFFFHIRPSRVGVDPWIWVVVGDIPSAYLPLSDCETPRDVFRTYVRGMRRWVEFARKAQPGTTSPPDVPPVNLPATPYWAEQINQKLYGLILAVKPFFDDETGTVS